MAEVLCTECTWAGDYDDTVEDDEHMGACPECHASTTDEVDGSSDSDDLSDMYGD